MAARPEELRQYFKGGLQQAFLEHYREQMSHATKIVLSREKGRNARVSIPEMFPFGLHSVLTMCHIKVGRAIGDLEAGNEDEVEDSLLDLINYAAFAVAYHKLSKQMEAQSAKDDPYSNSPDSRLNTLLREQGDAFGTQSSSSKRAIPRILQEGVE